MLCLEINQEVLKNSHYWKTNCFIFFTHILLGYHLQNFLNEQTSFLNELGSELLKREMYKDHNDKFSASKNVFRYILDKHALLKN